MSNLLLTTVPIEQQETIIGGVADITNGNMYASHSFVAIVNNITYVTNIFNFFIYPPNQGRKHRRGRC